MRYTKFLRGALCFFAVLVWGDRGSLCAAPQPTAPANTGTDTLAALGEKMKALEAQLNQTQAQLRLVQSELGFPEPPQAANPSASLLENAGPRRMSNLALVQTQKALASLRKDPAGVGMTPEERDFVDKVNRTRMQHGLRALAVDPLLLVDARGHSQEMAALGYFSDRVVSPLALARSFVVCATAPCRLRCRSLRQPYGHRM